MVRDQIFISYSHADSNWLNRLQTMLIPLQRQGKLKVWADTDIRPGQLWKEEIKQALARTKVAVLLVSPDFLASDFIDKHELPLLLEEAQRGGLIILWIPIRPSLYWETEIKRYRAVYDPKSPLSLLNPAHQETALIEIVRKIKDAFPNKQLKNMESQLAKVGSDAKDGTDQEDDHGPRWKVLGALSRWLLTRRHSLPSDTLSGSTSSNMVASQGSITTGGNLTTTASDSGIAIGISTAPITITQTLSELDYISEKQKKQLLTVYEDQVRQAPEKARYHLALGLHYLDLGFYSQASSALLRAHQRDPLDSDTLYYLALAECQGRSPSSLRLSQIEVIERYLRAAVANSMPKAHYLYFWAQVKYDYYQMKSLRVPPPSIDELIQRAELAEISKNQLRHLLRYVLAPSSPITEIIQKKI